MPPIDLILLILIAGFAMFGLWFGAVHTLGSLAGTVVGAFLGGRYAIPLGDWLVGVTGWDEALSRVIMFTVAFIIINRLVGVVFYIVEQTVELATRLPFLRSLNRLLGLILGTFEGIITIGLIVYVMQTFPISGDLIAAIDASAVAAGTKAASSFLLPLLPEAFDAAQGGAEVFQSL